MQYLKTFLVSLNLSFWLFFFFIIIISGLFVGVVCLFVFLGPEVQRDKAMTSDQIESFANRLGEQWKALAPYLEMKDSDIWQIESDSEDMKMRAKQLLVAWQDQEGTHATPENLINALNKAGLSDLVESLTNDTEGSN